MEKSKPAGNNAGKGAVEIRTQQKQSYVSSEIRQTDNLWMYKLQATNLKK